MSYRTKVNLIMVVTISFGMILMSACGKRVATTETTEPEMPGVEAGRAVSPELITEPPVPQVEGLQEHAPTEEIGNGALQPYRVKGISDVYFDFDRHLIRDDARETLYDNASILKKREFKKVVVEGHADERGTTDYNLALGERRAESTKRYLTTLGISPSKISVISFGKEKPFCADHNEDCWQQNRRAHFVMTE